MKMKSITTLCTMFFLFTVNNVYAYPGKSLEGLCQSKTFHQSKQISGMNISTENQTYAMNVLIDNSWYNLDFKEGYNKVFSRSEMYKIAQWAYERNLFINACTDNGYITGIELVAP